MNPNQLIFLRNQHLNPHGVTLQPGKPEQKIFGKITSWRRRSSSLALFLFTTYIILSHLQNANPAWKPLGLDNLKAIRQAEEDELLVRKVVDKIRTEGLKPSRYV